MAETKAVHLALRQHLKTASGIPTLARENRDFTPTSGTVYVEEEFVPGPRNVRTTLPGGIVEWTGLYIVKWYGIARDGVDAIRTGVDAILAVFLPGSALALSGGGVVRIRTQPAPYPGQITPIDGGWAVCVVTIPWRLDAPLP